MNIGIRTRNFIRSHRLWIIVLLTVFVVSLSARFYIKMGLSGDEPHYLVMANSLKSDHDLNLKNDYLLRTYRPYYPDELEPHINWALTPRTSERWYSIHGPGLPLLILPGVFISKRLGAVLIMIGFGLLAALGGMLMSRTISSKNYTMLAGTMLGLSIPFLALAGYIFPDMIIGALVAIIFALIGSRLKTIWREIVIGILAAVLVWVHVKTSLLAGSLILVEAWFIIKNFDGKTDRTKQLAALVIPFGILLAFLQFKFYQWFGVLTPNGIYKGNNQLFQLSPFKALLAIIVDPFKGILVLSPIWFCSFIGFPEWYRRNKQQLILVLLVIVPSIIVQSTFNDWAGGWSPPARYTMQYLPALLPALALGLEVMFRNAQLRLVAILLVILQAILAVAYILLRPPWQFAGQPAPFFLALQNKLHLHVGTTVYFDGMATPTTAGVAVIIACTMVGTSLVFAQRLYSRKT